MKLTDVWGIMLNNRAKADSQQVLERLEIKNGDVIADVGSGGGYFAFEFAKRVKKEGKVFAVDTNADLLGFINKRSKKQGIQNLITIMADESGFGLSGENCNLIFLRNVFHHLDNAEVYFQNLQQSLKPNGKIAIIEWQDKNGACAMRNGHSTPESKIFKVMETAGFKQVNSFDFLRNQSFNIFALNSAPPKSS